VQISIPTSSQASSISAVINNRVQGELNKIMRSPTKRLRHGVDNRIASAIRLSDQGQDRNMGPASSEACLRRCLGRPFYDGGHALSGFSEAYKLASPPPSGFEEIDQHAAAVHSFKSLDSGKGTKASKREQLACSDLLLARGADWRIPFNDQPVPSQPARPPVKSNKPAT